METKTKVKHTPGPWEVSKSGGDRLIYAETEHAFDLAIVRDGGNEGEVEANARLIAAAPQLLAALQAVCEHLFLLPTDTQDKVNAALDKSESAA